MEPLMTPEEVAALLRVDVAVIHQLVHMGALPAYCIVGDARCVPSEVAEYLRSQRQAPPQAGEQGCPLSDVVMQIARKVLFKVRLGCVAGMHDALTAAQQEAVLLGHHSIDTEHLLLGVRHEEQGVAMQLLHSMGIDTQRVRKARGGQGNATGQECDHSGYGGGAPAWALLAWNSASASRFAA